MLSAENCGLENGLETAAYCQSSSGIMRHLMQSVTLCRARISRWTSELWRRLQSPLRCPGLLICEGTNNFGYRLLIIGYAFYLLLSL